MDSLPRRTYRAVGLIYRLIGRLKTGNVENRLLLYGHMSILNGVLYYFRDETKGIPCAPDGWVSPSSAANVAARSVGWHAVA